MSKIQEAYLEMQKASGIEVGDSVKVLRKFSDDEMGLYAIWNPAMEITIGKTGEVIGFGERSIIVDICDDAWHYPFFVLEKVHSAKRNEKELDSWCGKETIVI